MLPDWTVPEWSAFFIALGTFVNTVLIAVGTFILKVKSENNAAKIDANTKLTQEGAEDAANNAKAAVFAASTAAKKTEELHSQLNGKLETLITGIVKTHVDPITRAFDDHNAQDEKNMQEIRAAISDIKKSMVK